MYVFAFMYEPASLPSKPAKCKAWWAVMTDLKRSTTLCSEIWPFWLIMMLPFLQNYNHTQILLHTNHTCHAFTIMPDHHHLTQAPADFHPKSLSAFGKRRFKPANKPFVPGDDMDPLVCLLSAHPFSSQWWGLHGETHIARLQPGGFLVVFIKYLYIIIIILIYWLNIPNNY